MKQPTSLLHIYCKPSHLKHVGHIGTSLQGKYHDHRPKHIVKMPSTQVFTPCHEGVIKGVWTTQI